MNEQEKINVDLHKKKKIFQEGKMVKVHLRKDSWTT